MRYLQSMRSSLRWLLYAQTLRRQFDRPPLTGFDLYVRWYRKYAPGGTVLGGLETEVREAKKGLWVDPAPITVGLSQS